MAKGGTTSTTITRVYERLRSGHLGFSLIASLKTQHGLAGTPLMLNSVSILHHNFALYPAKHCRSLGWQNVRYPQAYDSHREEKKIT